MAQDGRLDFETSFVVIDRDSDADDLAGVTQDVSGLMRADAAEALIALRAGDDGGLLPEEGHILADSLDGVLADAFGEHAGAGDVEVSDEAGELVAKGPDGNEVRVREIGSDALEELGGADADAKATDVTRTMATGLAWARSEPVRLAERSFGQRPYERLSDPQEMREWFSEARMRLSELASRDFPPEGGPGGYYEVTGGGDYVSESDFMDVLPSPYLQDLYLALANDCQETSGDAHGRPIAEYAEHAGDAPWVSSVLSEALDSDDAGCFYTEFFEEDYEDSGHEWEFDPTPILDSIFLGKTPETGQERVPDGPRVKDGVGPTSPKLDELPGMSEATSKASGRAEAQRAAGQVQTRRDER